MHRFWKNMGSKGFDDNFYHARAESFVHESECFGRPSGECLIACLDRVSNAKRDRE